MPAKKSTRAGKGATTRVQKPGKLMLDNPIIPPELDEDIDDDLAFNSDDEKMFGHFFQNHSSSSKGTEDVSKPKKTTKKRKHPAREEKDPYGGSEDTDGDGGDDDDDDGLVDLSEMLDSSIAASPAEAKTKPKSRSAVVDEEPEALIDAGVAPSTATKKKKKRDKKASLVGESIYDASSVGVDGNYGSYGEAVRNLIRSDDSAAARRLEDSLHNKKNVIATDLDNKSKERITRKEVRKVVEESLDKYKHAVRQLNTAKHVTFPLRGPEENPVPGTLGAIAASSEAMLSSNTTNRAPSTAAAAAPATITAASPAQSLASRLSSLLSDAGISRKQVQAARVASGDDGTFIGFDAATADGDDGEGGGAHTNYGAAVASNVKYEAKLKAMLAYENSRRKRFNKIKSKTYRRILRKEKDRERERRQKAYELLHPEAARKKLAEKLMKARIEERVTQKHKNSSAWVRHAKKYAKFDANTKEAVDEHNQLHARLMQKMEQDAGDEDYDRYVRGGEDGDSSAEEEEERLVDELLADPSKVGSLLTDTDDAAAALAGADPVTRARHELKQMKFMKKAAERQEKALREDMNLLKADIERYQHGGNVGEEEGATVTEGEHSQSSHALRLASRSFGSTSRGDDSSAVEPIALKERDGIRAATGGLSAFARDKGTSRRAQTGDDSSAVTSGDFAGKRARGSTTSTRKVVTFDSLNEEEEEESEEEGEEEDEEEEEDENKPAHLDDDGSGESGAGPSPDVLSSADLSLHQEYLISRAFANDDVDDDFVREKQQQVDQLTRPEDPNANLPGWGEWGGEDSRLNARHRERQEHRDLQRSIERTFLQRSRADAALDHVIINHDGVELVPDRMMVHMVPRPFNNPQEFARSLRQPIGPEWGSALSFKEGVRPRVETTQGRTIAPLDESARKAKAPKTKRRKLEKRPNSTKSS